LMRMMTLPVELSGTAAVTQMPGESDWTVAMTSESAPRRPVTAC
jgi:hypothetical protein